MTWEEAVISIRNKPEWQNIIDGCYFDVDLVKNVERFRSGDEFKETLNIIGKYCSAKSPRLLDIGAGNGISAVSFALEGFEVKALEPDASETVGNGAIKFLKDHYKLQNLEITDKWGENMPYENDYFDVAYARQVMHHARNLHDFVKETARVIKPGGIYFANRDHIVNDENQLKEFLDIHPLHKFYGGENAYSKEQYIKAITAAGLKVRKVYEHLESVILTDRAYDKYYFNNKLAKYIGFRLAFVPVIAKLYKFLHKKANNNYSGVPGRVYAFICQK